MKKLWLVLILTLAMSPLAMACKGEGCSYPKGGGDYQEKSPSPKGGCPIVAKFMHEAHEMLEHRKQIEVTAEQIKAIKGLKTDLQKAEIQGAAARDIMMLDVKAALSEDPVNREVLSGLIDQGMQGMAGGAKQILALYTKLQDVLSAEQKQKLKEVHHKA